MNSTADIDWQLVVVLAIVTVAAILGVIRIIRHFRTKDSSCESGCSGCPINSCPTDKRSRTGNMSHRD